MAAGLTARNDEDIDAGAHLRQGVVARADERRDRHAVPLAEFEHQWRRNAERVGNQLDGMAKGDLEKLRGAILAHIVAEALPRLARIVEAARVDIIFAEQVGGEGYEGGCFVFDERVALDPRLQPLVDGETTAEAAA